MAKLPTITFCEDDGNAVLSKRYDVEVYVGCDRYAITVWPKFEFDGASIPRALWRLCGHPLESPRIAAALAHDWLYKSHAVDRATADKIYNAIEKAVGLPAWRTGAEYYALRAFGWAAWNSHGFDENVLALDEGHITRNGLEVME